MDALLDARQALIDDPPPKCPYFTLPDLDHFQKVERPRQRPTYASITAIWGPAHKMTDECSTEFLLQLLKHSKWEPDFDAVAREWNVNGPSTIKTRLKVIVKNNGYKLVGDNKIVDDKRPPVPSSASNNKSRKSLKESNNGQDINATPQAKKRKSTEAEEVARSKKIKKQKGYQQAGNATDSESSEPVIAKGTEGPREPIQ